MKERIKQNYQRNLPKVAVVFMFFNVFMAAITPVSPPPFYSACNSIKIKEAKKG